jgi:hypothetical protein
MGPKHYLVCADCHDAVENIDPVAADEAAALGQGAIT